MNYNDFTRCMVSVVDELVLGADCTKIRHEIASHLTSTLSMKHREYGHDEDALVNFKDASDLFEESPESILLSYKLKHDVSIKRVVEQLPKVDMAVVKEKIGDAMAYLILLYALLQERHDGGKECTCG